MSTKARKARKRAGEKLIREPRVGTPFMERAWVNALVPGTHGTKWAGAHIPRSYKQITEALYARNFLRDEKERKELHHDEH